MKLWLLKLKRATSRRSDYDFAYGFVVRAESARRARVLVSEAKDDAPGDEGREAWLDAERSTCMPLTTNAAEGVILRDFNAG